MKGSLKIRVNLDKKEYDKQLNDLATQIKQKQAEIKRLYDLQNTVGVKNINGKRYDYTTSIRTAELELEKLKNKYIQVSDSSKESTMTQSNNWTKLTSKMKRFALAMFSIRSIYALVSRASSQYLSMDTELAEKLTSVWKGLGSFLAPALELISNALLKAIGYLNVFVKALTGIDFIARANTKALKSQASATKELKKQMLGFDEVNSFADTTTSSSSSSSSGLINIPELNGEYVEKLQELAEWLKKNKELVEAVGAALLIAFGVTMIAKIVKGIKTLIGVGGTASSASAASGLAGIAYFLGILAAGVIIYIAAKNLIKVINQVKELNKQYEALNDLQDANTTIVGNLAEQTKELAAAGELNEKEVKNVANAYENQISTSEDLISKMQNEKSVIGALTGENSKLKESQIGEYNTIKNVIEKYGELYDQHILDSNGEKQYIQTLKNTITYLENAGVNVDSLKEKYKEITKQNWVVKMQAEVDANGIEEIYQHAKKIVNNTLSGTLKSITMNAINNLYNKVKSTGKLATGGIVNNPGSGVSLGNVITGEAGREGVIPLTDSGAMEELGATIGRYITINNVIDNYMDSRRINRVMAQSKSTSDFASNK